MNLATLIIEHPDDARALHERGRWISWADVRRRSALVQLGLARFGVGIDDRVAIAWPTSSDFVYAYLGVLSTGAIAVPVNPNSPPSELARQLTKVSASVLLAGGSGADNAQGVTASPEAPAGLRVLVAPRDSTTEDARPWDEVTSETESGDSKMVTFDPVPRDDGDLAVVLFTSGTAGEARAAKLTHGNLRSNISQMLAVPDIYGPAEVGLAAVPLFHIFGLNVALGLTLATGASLVLEERFDPLASLALVEELGVTTLVGVPTMYAAWAAAAVGDKVARAKTLAGDIATHQLSTVRRAISGADALLPEVVENFERKFGVALWQGYGLTEASPAVSTSLGTLHNRPGSVGRPLPGVELRIVDESGDQVLDGDSGEIWVKGSNVFAGYWDDEEATREALPGGGWLRTGDIGVIGEEGDLYIVDRLKDLVIVSGFNVFPAEVERVIAAVPGVERVVVIGRPDPLTGESIEAAVLLTPGADLNEEELRDSCAEHLARYKCPSSIRFVSELPTGLAGKALRRAVRSQLT